MRQYRYLASDHTVAALRRLRGAWTAYRAERESLTVWLADGSAVRIAVERADVEPDVEAVRLTASAADPSARGAVGGVAAGGREAWASPPEPSEAAPAFGAGGNDLVLVTGATWVEAPPADPGGAAEDQAPAAHGSAAERPAPGSGSVVQFSGGPHQIPPSAAVVCLTTDALVVASPAGAGLLVRTGVQPNTLAVSADRAEIARFLGARGYGREGEPSG